MSRLANGDVGAAMAGIAATGSSGPLRGFLSRRRMARAERLLRGPHPARALRLLDKAARRGEAEAQARLGRCYLQGTGVPRNPAEAGHWLHEAAVGGHAQAQFLLAGLYLHGLGPAARTTPKTAAEMAQTRPDPATAAHWARRAAQAGLAEAQALLGHLIVTGQAEPAAKDEADSLLRRAAEQDCPQGHLGYALHLIGSAADEADWARLRHHAQRAAKAGLPSAVHLLSVLTMDGKSGAPEPARAIALLRQAAEAGLPVARRQLGLSLLAQSRLAQSRLALDHEEGLYWLRLSAHQGDRLAARKLAAILIAGGPAKRSPSEAARWLSLAMTMGDADAACDLARLVLSGDAGAPDAGLVRAWFAKAAEAGDPLAAYQYAVCLARGIGAERDERAALPWLATAAETIPEARLWHGRIQDGAASPAHPFISPTNARGDAARQTDSPNPAAVSLPAAATR